MSENIKLHISLTPGQYARLSGAASGSGLSVKEFIIRELRLYGDDPAASVECPHCRWGFAPWVIDRHIREKHSRAHQR